MLKCMYMFMYMYVYAYMYIPFQFFTLNLKHTGRSHQAAKYSRRDEDTKTFTWSPYLRRQHCPRLCVSSLLCLRCATRISSLGQMQVFESTSQPFLPHQ